MFKLDVKMLVSTTTATKLSQPWVKIIVFFYFFIVTQVDSMTFTCRCNYVESVTFFAPHASEREVVQDNKTTVDNRN